LPVIGVSPGAAYGTAKRWLPERFAEAAVRLAEELNGCVAVFGSAAERPLCEVVANAVRNAGVRAWNEAGETTLRQFINMTAACRVFLTNDSGAMHISSALGVPTVAIFGATDDIAPDRPIKRARGARARGLQPLPAAGMPHRPSVHDARDGRAGSANGAGTAQIGIWPSKRTFSMSGVGGGDFRDTVRRRSPCGSWTCACSPWVLRALPTATCSSRPAWAVSGLVRVRKHVLAEAVDRTGGCDVTLVITPEWGRVFRDRRSQTERAIMDGSPRSHPPDGRSALRFLKDAGGLGRVCRGARRRRAL
jgi:hypothetical protein